MPDISIGDIWGKVWPILFAILFFGFIIFIHELGHFVTAKLNKVTVHEFSIGMGPVIFKFHRKETQISLRLFPIGGFVQMDGEDEASDNPGAFCNKKVWQRIVIVAAGGIMNILLGLILCGVMNSTEDLIGTRTIAQFYDSAVSCNYGLQVDDKIVEVNGMHIFNSTDLSYAMVRDEDGIYDFTVIRNGEKTLLKNVKFDMQEINGTKTVVFDFSLYGLEKTPWLILKNSFLDTVSTARIVWLTLFDMVTGRYGITDLSGPIGTIDIIADVASEAAASEKITQIVNIMAFITINIGVFNLIPIPALDGGRLFFLIAEGIARKPILPKYEKYIHAAGMILLLALVAVISIKDVVYLFK